ncbi:GPI inositol deacylase [Elasticomyces elasticus]|uniref:GPI inositol-deacylase n=1 Tax=Exophiala sideris TaxID=1016849 RepID=A0ABR0JSS7_9EURO|nr:GPI inositol deacylase [Elasticomyces elasticus]KAK5040367.1 GPI inositol deacylase [Exophiala sideris]KAK5043206.1 GPI inositol deacylase [Exophiala sideris]KAK5068745.1 GPI inositol deacylase [Exophiala sideris]KAK5186343.1 GPI inositol deacylase [Eurotiomycetes sp. CCFEE 6388]
MLLKPKEDAGDSQSNADVRGLHKFRAQSPWTWRPLTLITTALALLSLSIIVRSSLKLQLDPQGCVMSMMSPTYIKLSGFDTEHSRFATKYSLYLYREEGVDEYTQDNIGLRGAPVLFIPGNAGSYKQVRSLSSEASRYYHNVLRHDTNAMKEGVRAFDFFTIDFNEDLSAFHGQTLLDQAEYVNEAVAYILSLYHDGNRLRRDAQLPDPSSVILIGHSMGGIVARTVLVTPKYQANSVNTIITMSTPHARPPVTFDADVVSLYQQVNQYWRESYLQKWASNNPLWHTTWISIAGGGRDTTVPSDYTNIASIVPESHGFTVFTSTIPNVWTSMDHLAITWADQVRKTVIRSLYDVVDVRRAGQTKPRAERMKAFRKWFLTGLEEETPKSIRETTHEVLLTLGDQSRSSVAKYNNVTIRQLGAQDHQSAVLLPIPTVDNSTSKRFSFLTDQQLDAQGSFEKMEVLFCSAFPLAGGLTSMPLPVQFDFSSGDASSTRLACKRPAGDGIQLPASTRMSQFAFDTQQQQPFTYLNYDLRDLQDYQFVAIVDKSTEISNGWAYAEIVSNVDSVIDSNVGLPRLLFRGLNVELPPTRPVVTDIRVPSLRSSLLTYSLQVRQHGCSADSELFTPLVRQHIENPHESKFFVNFKQGDINLHGVAPFMPPTLDGREPKSGVAFQIWSDPTCNSSLEVRLRADPVGSLGKLVVRYRTVFAAFPLLVVAMVLRKQFRVYDNSGVFISFSESLDQSLRLPLPILLLSMTFFATAFTTAGTANIRPDHHTHSNGTAVNFSQNDLLLGSQDTFFWFLVPLAGLLSVGACVILNYAILALLDVVVTITSLVSQSYVKVDDGEKGIASAFIASTPRRRAINTAVLLFLVATIIPYPFAYVVACIVQLTTCTRALRYAKESRSGAAHNFFNYTYSILILMLWVLPINLPTLVVWIHNMAVHWLTPFSSHHNVLSIAPFILLVETLSSGMMVPSVRSFRWATNLLFFALAVYSALYGMTYAYRLHYIANIIALWLVLLHFSNYQRRITT